MKKLIDPAQQAPQTVVLAMDEAARYVQATTTAGWGPRGQPRIVRRDAGRRKTSCSGTLDLQTGRAIVTQVETMHAQATAAHVTTIRAQYPDVPMLLLWDRAPWQRGGEIREVRAANPRLHLVVFPTASPDLNPQEHVWKAARRAISHNHTQSRLRGLAARFHEYVTNTTFRSALLDQYGWNLVCPRFT